ncbi:MAG: hypothetical protein OXU67_09920 [Chloroflexota bacterium]|nr:hypothetical protein [Chloroflexota bacterium]
MFVFRQEGGTDNWGYASLEFGTNPFQGESRTIHAENGAWSWTTLHFRQVTTCFKMLVVNGRARLYEQTIEWEQAP